MKLCITCKNCVFSEGFYYSELTYTENEIYCANHKNVNAPFESQETFLKWNTYADNCKLFSPAK